jgi:hypothetical protein
MTRQRHPVVIPQTIEVEAKPDYVVAIIRLGNSTIGLRFISPEHLIKFFVSLMEKAILIWPDDPYIKEYLSQE